MSILQRSRWESGQPVITWWAALAWRLRLLRQRSRVCLLLVKLRQDCTERIVWAETRFRISWFLDGGLDLRRRSTRGQWVREILIRAKSTRPRRKCWNPLRAAMVKVLIEFMRHCRMLCKVMLESFVMNRICRQDFRRLAR